MGCLKVSAGCKNCYAETLTTNRMGLHVWGPPGKTLRQPVKSVWKNVEKWQREATSGKPGAMGPGHPHLVFVGSLMDWAEDAPGLDEIRAQIWPLIRRCPDLHFQMLTKRPERIASLLPDDWGEGYPNVWLGTSIEDERVAWRADELAKVPAVVRFVSYEPALGPLDLSPWFGYDPIHGEAKDEHRRQCLSCGYQWRTRNRQPRQDLAIGESARRQEPERDDRDSMRKDQGGAPPHHGLPPNPCDVRRTALQRPRPSARVEALSRPDTARPTDQSQECHSRRQQAGEPGACDGERERSGPALVRPVGGAESPVEVDRCPSCGDSRVALRRGDAVLHRDGVWRELPAHLKDLPGSAPLITWTIYGGESGPGHRSEGTPDDPKLWARDMLRACRAAGVAYFHKQSAAFRTEMGIELDGEVIREYPVPREVPAFAPTLFAEAM